MTVTIREIKEQDNAAVEAIIRSCLKEYGGDREGTAWCDPDLGRFSEIYGEPEMRYWVAEDHAGRILGGAGFGPLPGEEGVCELQKMYTLPEARGTGIAHRLVETVLQHAADHYALCYLETFGNMSRAQSFYRKHGFEQTDQPMGSTGHISCDVFFTKRLRKDTQ
ncbi:GNAT family N-acetyltransferase [Faecalibaculum rodentium]|uniref:GNAT family N-acetyltransferase n=1 Tax=Faecalibaculum rodentium TaxID=1702221 RepID=UPI00259B1B1E|nr:GNAT family N-acetyltransferase [Faecalibaculum rodentium]